MNFCKKHVGWVLILVNALAVVSGVVFYKKFVGEESTPLLSVIFGWQWLYFAVLSSVALVVAFISKNKRLAGVAATIIVALLVLYIPARIVESSRIYITGDGGPSGPQLACLLWNANDSTVSAISQNSFGACTLFSIPSYNKFLIDRSPEADQLESTPTYYAMLLVNEAALLGALYYAHKKVTAKPNTSKTKTV
jgi:hypothetical protein